MKKRCIAGIVLALISVFQADAIRVAKIVNSPRAIEDAQKTFEQALRNNDTKMAKDVIERLKKVGQVELALRLNSRLKNQTWDKTVVADLGGSEDPISNSIRRLHPSKRKRAERTEQVAVQKKLQVQERVDVTVKPAPEVHIAYTPKPEVDHSSGSSRLMAERLMQAIQAEQQVRDELYATNRKLIMLEQDVNSLRSKEQSWQSNQGIIQELSVAKEELDRRHAEAQHTVALLESQVNSLKQVEELAESVTRENEELFAQTQELQENNQELTGQLSVVQCELEVTQIELKNADVVLNKTPRELAKECIENELSAREAEQRCLAQAQEHHASIELLEKDLQRTEQLLSNAEQEKQNTAATLESIKMAYAASENKCSQQSQEVGRCLSVIAQLEQDIKKSEEAQEQLESILAQGKQKYVQLAESARSKMEQLKGDLKEACEQVNQQAEQLKAERAEHEVVCVQLAQVQDIMQGHDAQIAQLSANVEAKTEEVAALTAQEQELRVSVNEKDQLLATAIDERNSAYAEYNSVNQQVATLNQELLGWSMRYDELVNDHTDKVHNLTQQVASAEKIIQEQQDDFRAQTEELKSKRKEAIRRATKSARAKITKLQESNSGLQMAVSKLQEERTLTNKQCSDMKVAMHNLTQELDHTSEKLAVVESDHDALCQRYAILNQQFTSAGSSLSATTAERDQLKTECVALEQRVCSLQQDLEAQEAQWQKVSSEKNDMLSSVKRLTGELAELRASSSNELQAQAQQLKSKSKQAIQAIMQTANEKLEVFKQKNTELEAMLMNVEHEKKEKQAQLQEQLDTMKQILAEKESKMKYVGEKQAKILHQKQALENQYSKLNGNVQELSEELASVQNELTVVYNEKNNLQIACSDLNEQVGSLQKQLHEQVEGIKQRGQKKIQTIVQAANTKLDALKEENSQLKEALANVEHEQFQRRVLLEEQLENLKSKFAQLNAGDKSISQAA